MCSQNCLTKLCEMIEHNESDNEQQHIISVKDLTQVDFDPDLFDDLLWIDVGHKRIVTTISSDDTEIACTLHSKASFSYPRMGMYIHSPPPNVDKITPMVDGELFVLKGSNGNFNVHFRNGDLYEADVTTDGHGLIDVDAGFEYVRGEEEDKIFLLWWNVWNVRNLYGHKGIDVLTLHKTIKFDFGKGPIETKLPTFDLELPSDGWILHQGPQQYWLKKQPSIDINRQTLDQLRAEDVPITLDDESYINSEQISEYVRTKIDCPCESCRSHYSFRRYRPDLEKPNSIQHIINILESLSVLDYYKKTAGEVNFQNLFFVNEL